MSARRCLTTNIGELDAAKKKPDEEILAYIVKHDLQLD
jgi:hypothetical protein